MVSHDPRIVIMHVITTTRDEAFARASVVRLMSLFIHS